MWFEHDSKGGVLWEHHAAGSCAFCMALLLNIVLRKEQMDNHLQEAGFMALITDQPAILKESQMPVSIPTSHPCFYTQCMLSNNRLYSTVPSQERICNYNRERPNSLRSQCWLAYSPFCDEDYVSANSPRQVLFVLFMFKHSLTVGEANPLLQYPHCIGPHWPCMQTGSCSWNVVSNWK